jgi:hypothetical protein
VRSLRYSVLVELLVEVEGLFTLPSPATPTWAKAGMARALAKIAAVSAVKVSFIGGLLGGCGW